MANYNSAYTGANIDKGVKKSLAKATVVSADGTGEYTTLTAAMTAGKTNIFIKNGIYIENVTISVNETYIEGESREGVIFRPNTPSNDVMRLYASYCYMSNITIDAMTTNAQAALAIGDGKTPGNPDLTIGIYNTIDNCYIKGSNSTFALYVAGASYARYGPTLAAYAAGNLHCGNVIKNCLFDTGYNQDAYAFDLQKEGTLINNTFLHGRVAYYMNLKSTFINNKVVDSLSHGIFITGTSSENVISDNIFDNCTNASIRLDYLTEHDPLDADTATRHNVVANNIIKNGQFSGIELVGAPTNPLVDNIIVNNMINTVYNHGISLQYVEDCIIDGNEIIKPGTDVTAGNRGSGIYLVVGAINNTIQNNKIIDRRLTNYCKGGIVDREIAGSTGNKILNNTLDCTNSERSIWIISDNNVIEGNTISGGNYAGIYLSGVTDCVVKDNISKNNTNFANNVLYEIDLTNVTNSQILNNLCISDATNKANTDIFETGTCSGNIFKGNKQIGATNTKVNEDVLSNDSSSTDNTIVRMHNTTGKVIQGSLVTIDDSGSINIPSGQKYKINNVNLSASDVGAEPTLTKGNLSENTSSVLTIGNGTGSVIGSGTTIQVKQASSIQSGYLSNSDFSTFAGKQNALSFSNLIGTSDQIVLSVSGTGVLVGSSNITLSLPQSIATTSEVQFSKLNLSKTTLANTGHNLINNSIVSVVNSAGSYDYTGIVNNLYNYTQSANNTGTISGIINNSYINGGGFTQQLTAQYGLSNNVGLRIGAGTIDYCYGIQNYLYHTSGIINTFYGLYLDSDNGAGTVYNKWGMYVKDSTMNNYFAGNMYLGTTVVGLGWQAAYRAIQTPENAFFDSGTDTIGLYQNIFYDGAEKYRTSDIGASYSISNGVHYWKVITTGTQYNASSGNTTTVLTINNLGQFGVLTSPVSNQTFTMSKSVTNTDHIVQNNVLNIIHNLAASKTYTGFYNNISNYAQSADNTGALTGIANDAFINSASFTGSILSSQYGISNVIGIGTGNGTITDVYGIQNYLYNNSGTITNFYGFYANASNGGGTVTNRWGVYINDSNMKNYFAGNIYLGSNVTGLGWQAAYRAIQTVENAVFDSGADKVGLYQNIFYDGDEKYRTTGKGASYYMEDGSHHWVVFSYGTQNNSATGNGTTPLQITDTGSIRTNLTSLRALQVGATNNLEVSVTSSAELAFLSGVTSPIQTQFSGKQDTLSFGTLSGTSNQVVLSTSGTNVLVNGTNITLSLPQDIATNSSVQFGNLGLGTASTATDKLIISTISTTNNNKAINVSSTGATTGTNYGVYSSVSGASVANWAFYAAAGNIYSYGNIGVGTTDIEAWDSSSKVIEAYASAVKFATASSSIEIVSNAHYTTVEAVTDWRYKTTDEASLYQQYGGVHTFLVAGSGTADTAISWATALTINNSSNIGLNGATIPAINTDFHVIEASNSSLMFGKATSNHISISSNAYYKTDSKWYRKSATYASNYYQTAGTHVFRVAASGGADSEIASWTDALTINNAANLLVNGATSETSAIGTLTMKQGTNPSTSTIDQISIFATSGANATLGLRTEAAVVTEASTPDSTLVIYVNGAAFKLCMEAV